MEFKKGDWVVCINNKGGYEDKLPYNRAYRVVKDGAGFTTVVDVSGADVAGYTHRFQPAKSHYLLKFKKYYDAISSKQE